MGAPDLTTVSGLLDSSFFDFLSCFAFFFFAGTRFLLRRNSQYNRLEIYKRTARGSLQLGYRASQNSGTERRNSTPMRALPLTRGLT